MYILNSFYFDFKLKCYRRKRLDISIYFFIFFTGVNIGYTIIAEFTTVRHSLLLFTV